MLRGVGRYGGRGGDLGQERGGCTGSSWLQRRVRKAVCKIGRKLGNTSTALAPCKLRKQDVGLSASSDFCLGL